MSDGPRARSLAYSLLAKLLIDGLDADRLATVRALSGWLLDDGELVDLEQLAARHHACFHLGVFPYAGVFLDPEAIAGAKADLAAESYDAAGFRPRLDEVAGDHLGVMLAFLAFASRRPELDELAAGFLESCVLSWLPALVVAADALDEPFWSRVLRAALELAAQHRTKLPHVGTGRPGLLVDEHLLADPRTGLRQIAEFLATPVASGVFLSRSDIARLGRQHELAHGFGPRALVLDNLLRGAVERDRLANLLASLDRVLVERAAAMVELSAPLGLHDHAAPWLAGMARTQVVIARIASAGAAG